MSDTIKQSLARTGGETWCLAVQIGATCRMAFLVGVPAIRKIQNTGRPCRAHGRVHQGVEWTIDASMKSEILDAGDGVTLGANLFMWRFDGKFRQV